MQRRLAAILAADVVGYSRLMGADEIGNLTSLKSHRRELVDSGISEHHGRIVKTTGDGMLVEFASVVDAVGCAVKIQRSMVRRNAAIPAEKQNIFRMGINVGDIIIDGGDIFGDGFRHFNPVDCRRKNSTGKAGAFARWKKPFCIQALKILSTLNADRRGGAGFHPSQHRIEAVKAFDLTAEGGQGFADRGDRIARQAG